MQTHWVDPSFIICWSNMRSVGTKRDALLGTVKVIHWLTTLLILTCHISSPQAQTDRNSGGLTDGQRYQLLQGETNYHLTQLGQISDDGTTLERTFLSPAHVQASKQIKSWMLQSGLHTWTDQVANVHGRISARNTTAPALILGSHYDTVKDAGRFDGALGIIAGIAAVKTSILQRAVKAGLVSSADCDNIIANRVAVAELLGPGNIRQLFANPIEVIAFSDEEGVRFSTTLLGSRAVVGSLVQPSNLLLQQGKEGLSVGEVLRQHGFDPSVESVQAMAMKPEQVKGYVEVHLEQGPVLEVGAQPLGVVSSIAGQTRLSVSMLGMQGHAGTVPMSIRRDPLAAAAEAIHSIEQRCQQFKPAAHGRDLQSRNAEATEVPVDEDSALVCTVGSISVWPGASNVIPGSANFSVDIRAPQDSLRAVVVSDVTTSIEQICHQRGLQCMVDRVHDAEAVQCSPGIVQGLVAAVEASEEMYEACKQAASEHKEQSLPSSTTDVVQDQCTNPAVETTDSEAAQTQDGSSQNRQDPQSNAGRGQQGDIGRGCAELQQELAKDEEVQVRAEAAVQRGASSVPVLVSGAGHDGLAMANLTQIGMVFVRCRGGISHSPLEHVSDDDVGRAAAALYLYLESNT